MKRGIDQGATVLPEEPPCAWCGQVVKRGEGARRDGEAGSYVTHDQCFDAGVAELQATGKLCPRRHERGKTCGEMHR